MRKRDIAKGRIDCSQRIKLLRDQLEHTVNEDDRRRLLSDIHDTRNKRNRLQIAASRFK